MKQVTLLAALAAVIVIVVSTLYASPAKNSKKPILTPVTAAVAGFTCPSCVSKLNSHLTSRKGVSDVKVTFKPGQVSAKLDESIITSSEFIATINAHGKATEPQSPYTAALVAYVDKAECKDEKVMCDDCVKEITKTLKAVKGIAAVKYNPTTRLAAIDFAPKTKLSTATLAKSLTDLKYSVSFTGEKPAATKTEDSCPTCPGH